MKWVKSVQSVMAFVAMMVLVLSFVPVQKAYAFTGNYTKMQSITITDNGSVARANVPVILAGISGSAYNTSGYINVNGTDTGMTNNSTGVDITYMMDTTQSALVIPNLPAYGSVVYNLLMGASVNQTNFPMIVGSSGYITTPDSPNLESSSNFTTSLTGEVDTTSGVNKNLVYKTGAFRNYVSGTGNITSTIYIYTLTSPTGNSDPGGVWTDEALAYDDNVTTYAYPTQGTGWTNYLILTYPSSEWSDVQFYADNETNKVTQIDISVYDGSAWTSVYVGAYPTNTWQTKTLTPQTVTQARIRFYRNVLAYGSLAEFKFSVDTTLSVTATGITSGVRTVTTSADSTNLTIAVYDENSALLDSDTVALGGVSVPSNAAIWYFNQNNVMSYADNISISVNGTQQLWYEPTIMLVSTTIPDRSIDATSNPGTIVWGTNSNLVITYGSVINAPNVQTNDASGITAFGAYLDGAILGLGNNAYVNVGFDYGLDATYGYGRTPLVQYTTISSFFSQVISLYPNTTYHFRAVLVYGASLTVYGADKTFTTMNPSGSSTTIEIKSAKVFNNYMSSGNGDMLVVAEVINTYTSLYPNENSREHFTIQLIGTNNSTLLGAAPLSNWGDRPSSIYFNPTVVAANITQGSAYYVRVVGDSLSGNATEQYQLKPHSFWSGGDWKGYDMTGLDKWCVGTAINMGLSDAQNGDYYITSSTDRGAIINDTAGGFFTTGIPAIGERRPNLFTTTQYKTTVVAGTVTNFWDKTDADPTGWRSYVGTTFSDEVDVMAIPLGVTGQSFMAGVIMLVMLGCVMVVVGGTGGFGALGAVLISVPVLWLGTYFRIVPIAAIIIMVIGFGLLAIRQFIIKTL